MTNGWPKITRKRAVELLQRVIAALKRGYMWRDIKMHYTLRGGRASTPRGLGFNKDGLTILRRDINEAFARYGVKIAPADVNNAERVGDLALAILKRVP